MMLVHSKLTHKITLRFILFSFYISLNNWWMILVILYMFQGVNTGSLTIALTVTVWRFWLWLFKIKVIHFRFFMRFKSVPRHFKEWRMFLLHNWEELFWLKYQNFFLVTLVAPSNFIQNSCFHCLISHRIFVKFFIYHRTSLPEFCN